MVQRWGGRAGVAGVRLGREQRERAGSDEPLALGGRLGERGLTRTAAVDGDGSKARLRWQAECPGALWHGDVCHGPTLKLDGKRTPVRVHGLLDDASRYGINLARR